MFKEVAEMVIDQGTLIDRIDYNMEQSTKLAPLGWLLIYCQVVERMRSGLGQLERAEKYQRNTRPERCIFLLLTLITLCFFILVMKHS
ncbi:Syntaxin-16 [Phytophthora cactorum]|nr:Syntaxin-16 [Phytophthora cactorum]